MYACAKKTLKVFEIYFYKDLKAHTYAVILSFLTIKIFKRLPENHMSTFKTTDVHNIIYQLYSINM